MRGIIFHIRRQSKLIQLARCSNKLMFWHQDAPPPTCCYIEVEQVWSCLLHPCPLWESHLCYNHCHHLLATIQLWPLYLHPYRIQQILQWGIYIFASNFSLYPKYGVWTIYSTHYYFNLLKCSLTTINWHW